MASGLESAWIPLATAIFGGVGLKMAEHWLGRTKVKIDEAETLRGELRAEITSLREEVRILETDLNEWKGKYYDLRDKYSELNTQLTLAIRKLQDEAASSEGLDRPDPK